MKLKKLLAVVLFVSAVLLGVLVWNLREKNVKKEIEVIPWEEEAQTAEDSGEEKAQTEETEAETVYTAPEYDLCKILRVYPTAYIFSGGLF